MRKKLGLPYYPSVRAIDSTGRERNLLDDRFCGPAQQNGCDMTRNIPQPICCIGPQKVYSRSDIISSLSPLPRYVSLHLPFLSLGFHNSVLLISGARWERTQFWSSKLAVIVELYDKPTLMVKVCPVFRVGYADICIFHDHFPLLFPVFFLFMEIFKQWDG